MNISSIICHSRPRQGFNLELVLSLMVAFALTNCASNNPTCNSGGIVQRPCHSPGAATWAAPDGKRLPFLAELPPPGTKISAAVILVVGLDGTLCDYKSLSHALAQHGYAVYGSENRTMAYDPDPSGHGKAVPWHKWVRDLQGFTEFVRNECPGVPIFYHGHSFGAVIALETTAESDCVPLKQNAVPQGLILQSPAYALLPERSHPLMTALLWPWSWMRVPQLGMMEKRNLELTPDKNWNCAWMKSDDRVKEGYTIGWSRQAMKMGHKARLASERDGMPPVLALEGKKDFITLGGNKGDLLAKPQRDYQDYLRRQHKNHHWDLKIYAEGRHLLTEGPGKDEVIHDIIAWLDAQR